MKLQQIALQLYTLREHCKDRDALDETCRRVAEIGYRTVQVSGVNREAVPEAEIRAICEKHGLTICATHEASDEIRHQPERVIERLRALGCTLTAFPFPNGVDFTDEAAITSLIKDLDRSGKVLADAGIVLAYHNHHHEFRKLGGRPILERIYEETDARHLQGEPDTYWVQYGGSDPVAWCRKLAGRLPIIHLKDYRINTESKPEYAEIGAGNLDMPAIIKAAEASGCTWFAVEQDSCPGDPFDSIAQSFRYLSTLVSD